MIYSMPSGGIRKNIKEEMARKKALAKDDKSVDGIKDIVAGLNEIRTDQGTSSVDM